MGKPRMVASDRYKRRPAVVRYWGFKKHLLLLQPKVEWEGLSLEFHIAMPKSWNKEKKEKMHLRPHRSTPDLDNMIKAFTDCLLNDDSVVWWFGEMRKLWDYNGSIVILSAPHEP